MKRVLVGILAGLVFGIGAGLLTAEESEAKQLEWVEYEFMCDANGVEARYEDYIDYISGMCDPDADPDGAEMDRIMKAAETLEALSKLNPEN